MSISVTCSFEYDDDPLPGLNTCPDAKRFPRGHHVGSAKGTCHSEVVEFDCQCPAADIRHTSVDIGKIAQGSVYQAGSVSTS